jgi:hypothetical protein
LNPHELLDLFFLENIQLNEDFSQLPSALDEMRRIVELLLLYSASPDEYLTETILDTAGSGPHDEAGSKIESSPSILALTHQYSGSFREIEISERLDHLLIHVRAPPLNVL